MPLGTKVVIDPGDAKIVVLRQLQTGQVTLSVEPIAGRGAQVIGLRHVVVPKLLH